MSYLTSEKNQINVQPSPPLRNGGLYTESPFTLERQNFATQFSLALSGDTIAQSFVGLCYAYGRGITKDEKTAVTWFLKAAKQGNASAQYHLGKCYAYGTGVPKDEKAAVTWLQKAA